MPVRRFLNNQWISVDPPFSATGDRTYVALLRTVEGETGERRIVWTRGSSTSRDGINLERHAGSISFWRGGGYHSDLNNATFKFPHNQWVLLVFRHTLAKGPLQSSWYDFEKDTWVHIETESTEAIGAGGIDQLILGSSVATTEESTTGARADYAAAAAFARVLDLEEVESLAGVGSLSGWLGLTPSGLWLFNQGSVETPVLDLSGNDADQVGRRATTVVEAEPPIPYFAEDAVEAPSASAVASAGSVAVFAGAMQSATENYKGLPLPFPNLLVHPQRLGPPRLTAVERRALDAKR